MEARRADPGKAMALKCAPTMLRPCRTVAARVPEKVADPVYATPEFRQWREFVIKRAGGVCQSPGCGRSERRMFADHVVEIKDGGAKFDPANGQCLCGSCHTRKTAAARRKRGERRAEG